MTWLVVPALACLMTQAPVDVVVTAAAPVDPQRLADAMRAYLDEYGIRVETGGASAAGDLRRQLADARRIGEAVRALAVVRAERGAPGTIEIELVDLATGKSLVTEIPRPARDEDLYRALALKIQAILRSTLSEAPERLGPGSTLGRLVSGPPGPPRGAGARAPRLSLETGYTLVSFPVGGIGLQGVSVTAAFEARRWLELSLGAAALGSAQASGQDVVAVATIVPLLAGARLRLVGAHGELLAGPVAEIALASIAPSSATTEVVSTRRALAAAGAEVEGRLRIGTATWLYARAGALAMLLSVRYQVRGKPILDTSQLQVTAAAGIGVGLW